MKEEIFLTSLFIIILFNGFVILVEPETTSILNYDLTSLVVTAVTIAIPLSLNFLGSGFNDSALKIVFNCMILFSVLYRVEVYGYTIGLGLISTLTEPFSINNEIGLGWMIVNTIGFITFISGMLLLTGGD